MWLGFSSHWLTLWLLFQSSVCVCEFFWEYQSTMQGAQAHCGYLCQRSYSNNGGSGDWSPPCTCNSPTWRPAKTRTGPPLYFSETLYVCRNLNSGWFVITLFRSMHEYLRPTFWTGHGCASETSGKGCILFSNLYMAIPMDTSSRAPLGHYSLWLCMSGIQFPTDHFVDPF